MNKAEFVAEVADILKVSRADADKAVNAVQEAIIAALKNGEEVNLPQLGKFSVKETAEREGRNPATGEKITIAASKAINFKAGKAAKAALN